MSLEKHKQDWEDLALMDAYWAILSSPDKKMGKWDVEALFETGGREIAAEMDRSVQLGHPVERELALDFGCGVGRLTSALARYFSFCYGVDISEGMIRKARELNASLANCEFVINDTNHLPRFSNNSFDLVYASIVLQHMPSTLAIESYLTEFVRILKCDGLLSFQLPSRVPLKSRLQLRRRLYGLLRTLGFDPAFLHARLDLSPVRMTAMPEAQVRASLSRLGATVLEVLDDEAAPPSYRSKRYYVTKR